MQPDSGGLYQRVNEAGTKSWIFRFTQSGKLRAEIRNRSIPARLRSGSLEQRTRPGGKNSRKVRLQRPGLLGSCASWDTCEPSNSAADLSHRSARCWSTAFRCGSLARSANSVHRSARSRHCFASMPTAPPTACCVRAPARGSRDRQSRGPAASEGPSPPHHPEAARHRAPGAPCAGLLFFGLNILQAPSVGHRTDGRRVLAVC
jgi:hypothetical protein